MGKHLKRLWGWASKFDTLQSISGGWWWSKLTAVVIATTVGVWSWLEQLPGWFIALIVVILVWFTAKSITLLVNLIDRYHERTGSTDNPDTRIFDAIIYIAEESMWNDRYNEYLPGAARELRREAVAGNLTIYGKRSIAMVSSPMWYRFSDVHTMIDKDYWVTNKIDPLPILRKGTDEEVPDTISEVGRNDPCYIDMMVNKNQVKRLWPRKRAIVRKRFLR